MGRECRECLDYLDACSHCGGRSGKDYGLDDYWPGGGAYYFGKSDTALNNPPLKKKNMTEAVIIPRIKEVDREGVQKMRVNLLGAIAEFTLTSDGWYENTTLGLAINPQKTVCQKSPWYADHICDAPECPFQIVDGEVPAGPSCKATTKKIEVAVAPTKVAVVPTKIEVEVERAGGAVGWILNS